MSATGYFKAIILSIIFGKYCEEDSKCRMRIVTLCLIGSIFELEYSVHELGEILAYEGSKIPLEEWCDCGSCIEMN